MKKEKFDGNVLNYHEVTIKPIGEVAGFLKNLVPANIPETYTLKPRFEDIESEENIRNSVVAFRDFLYLFFDCLMSDGHLYAKPPKKPGSVSDYPFLSNVSCLLVEIGYHGKLAESGDLLVVTEIPSCTMKPNISAANTIACLRFLTLCGFVFSGIDLEAKTFTVSQTQPLEVSYPNNPATLVGLKVMAIADKELRKRRGWNDNSILACNYRLLKEEDTDIRDILKDFLHPLPGKIQEFVLKLHQRYTDMGMTCSMRVLGDINFAYADISKSRRVLSPTDIYARSIWKFSVSMKNGYCLFVRPKKTDKYADIIEKFPLYLREKIAKGYGCDRKRNERCQGGCQGICIPLKDSILDMSGDIEKWLDSEMPAFGGRLNERKI